MSDRKVEILAEVRGAGYGIEQTEPMIRVRGAEVLADASPLMRSLTLAPLLFAVRIADRVLHNQITLIRESVLIWVDADTPPMCWVRVDDRAPFAVSDTVATDLMMILERSVRLAQSAGVES